MDKLTFQETMQRLGISDATLRRWILRGKIKPIDREHDYERIYFDARDVERLLPKRSETEVLSARLGELEQRVETLEHHVSKLVEESQSARETTYFEKHSPQRPTMPVAPRIEVGRPIIPRTPARATGSDVEGTGRMVGFTDFYRAHGIKETSARHCIENGTVPIVPVNWPRGVKQALSEQGQREFIRAYRTNAHFRECGEEACVCHE